MIAIIDYNMGNVGSIRNMLKKLGAPAVITSDIEQISNASKLILPGVGAFDAGMTHINRMGLLDILNRRVLEEKVPILGICLGMQLLTAGSEEGVLPGLGWLEGKTVRFHFEAGSELRVPHMGWNSVKVRRDDSLFRSMVEDAAFYFVHSYHVVCDRDEHVLATTHYGYDFACAVQKGNIMGTQFHPEKSHRYGMQLLKNFAEQI